MNKFAFAGLVLAGLSSPALALEHNVVIDHADGPIAADYRGSVTIETRQVGAAGVAGRPSTLRCQWSASLTVERVATVGEALRTRRSLARENVASGSRPGWCETSDAAIARLVDARRETFRAALVELAEQDRAALLAEAEGAPRPGREG